MHVDKGIKPKNDAETWVEKGEALSKLGKYEEALEAFNKALELNPDYSSCWFSKALSLKQLGRNEEALEAIREWVKII